MSTMEFTQEDLERAMASSVCPSPAPAPFDPAVVGRDIAARYGVTYKDMMSRSKLGNLPVARMALWSFLKKHSWTYSQIAKYVDRNMDTVRYGIYRFDGKPFRSKRRRSRKAETLAVGGVV